MRVVASTILMFLLGAMFVSLFHMSSGMNMHGGMTDCPFMAHEEVVCPMNLADHLSAWKSAFLAIVPTVLLLLGVVSVVAFVLSTKPQLLFTKCRFRPKPLRYLRERTYTFVYRSLQELFARGILHPKVF